MTSCILRDEPLFFYHVHSSHTKFNLKNFILSQMCDNILAVIGHKSDNMTVSLCRKYIYIDESFCLSHIIHIISFVRDVK